MRVFASVSPPFKDKAKLRPPALLKRWSFPFHPQRKQSPTRTQSQDDADVTFAQLLGDLEIKYKMATDDLQFATETQGSIYFVHDFQGAQASLETCRLAYQQLLAHVRQQDIAQWIHGQWAPILQQMDDIMDILAATASATNDASSLSSYSTTAYLA